MLAFKIPENCNLGGVRSLEESPETFLGGSKRLCGASREVWEGCRRFWKGSGEVLGGLGGARRGEGLQRRADFRSLNEYEVREVGRKLEVRLSPGEDFRSLNEYEVR